MSEADTARRPGGARRSFAPWTDPAAQPLVRFDAVTKRFGAVTAVDRLSLDIYEKEFFALLGPSGCGKSTLLRALAGFEMPSEGRLVLGGEDITAVPPHRRPVNMMFQSYALFPHLTVEGNIAFGLKQDGLAKAEIDARVAEMLALVQLTPLARRKPQQLSGGQRQRVALARSLAKRPRVLLLDEPLGALDKKLRAETQFELMELQRRLGLTFIVVTHDQEEAMTMADRIGLMDHGRLVQVAVPPVIYEQPATRWVAQFIGDVNLLEGRVSDAAPGGLTIESAGAGTLQAPARDGVAVGATVFVAVRPEKVGIAPAGTPGANGASEPGANGAGGEVVDIGYLGDMSTYKVRLDTGLVMKASAANVTRLVERPIGWGERVWLSWRRDAAVVLTD